MRRLPTERPPCGTLPAYNLHLDLGEPTDPACRAARAAYDRRYRRTCDPVTRLRMLLDKRARQRALRQLADRYPMEFLRLMRAETTRLYVEAGLDGNGEPAQAAQPIRRTTCDLVPRGGTVTVKEHPRTAGGSP